MLNDNFYYISILILQENWRHLFKKRKKIQENFPHLFSYNPSPSSFFFNDVLTPIAASWEKPAQNLSPAPHFH